MRLSYNWLKALVPDLTLTPRELAELLTLHSFETTVGEEYGVPAGVKTVRITKIEKHPKDDRLRLATITAGKNEVTVVCGAPNIKVGQVVPYSSPGITLKDEAGASSVVKDTKIRGVESPGMLNSLRELGLHHDHGGIWILGDETPVGVELTELVPHDTLLEADVTPNRAHDCLSHIGVAREVAALLHLPATEPASPSQPVTEELVAGWVIEIESRRLCQRYFGALVENLVVAASPLWLQARLLAAGGKPINNLVDITNYVMLEYGNPTHMFDQRLLPGKRITIRRAAEKEKLVLLDDTEQELSSEDLLITASGKPVALAGVMGGKGSSVTDITSRGFLEVANFNAYHIQETSRRLAVRTESSLRFSKGLDPNLVSAAAYRALGLLVEFAQAEIIAVTDNYPEPVSPRVIPFNPARVGKIAGSDVFTEKQSKRILTSLRCSVDDKKNPWQITIPTARLDLEGEHDLVEEIIRVTGLDKVVAKSPVGVQPQSLPHAVYWREVVCQTLVELGFTETYNYSFENEHFGKLAGVSGQDHLSLVNPPAPELKNLRVSLLPGLLAHLDKNREAFHQNASPRAKSGGESALFEIGHVYKPGEGGRVPGVTEEVHLAAVVVGNYPSLPDIAQALAEALSIDPPQLHNVITSEITAALKYHMPVFGFEINLDELLANIEKAPPASRSLEEVQAEPIVPTAFAPLPKYPSVFRDISMLVDPSVSVEQAQEVIERAGKDLVADVDLFDEFEPRGTDQKSLAFHIEYRASDRTLTDEDVNPVHAKIIQALEEEISAQVR